MQSSDDGTLKDCVASFQGYLKQKADDCIALAAAYSCAGAAFAASIAAHQNKKRAANEERSSSYKENLRDEEDTHLLERVSREQARVDQAAASAEQVVTANQRDQNAAITDRIEWRDALLEDKNRIIQELRHNVDQLRLESMINDQAFIADLDLDCLLNINIDEACDDTQNATDLTVPTAARDEPTQHDATPDRQIQNATDLAVPTAARDEPTQHDATPDRQIQNATDLAVPTAARDEPTQHDATPDRQIQNATDLAVPTAARDEPTQHDATPDRQIQHPKSSHHIYDFSDDADDNGIVSVWLRRHFGGLKYGNTPVPFHEDDARNQNATDLAVPTAARDEPTQHDATPDRQIQHPKSSHHIYDFSDDADDNGIDFVWVHRYFAGLTCGNTPVPVRKRLHEDDARNQVLKPEPTPATSSAASQNSGRFYKTRRVDRKNRRK